MPRLTVKSMGEMLRLPMQDQVRILREQKYPKRSPSKFKTPYYGPAATSIRKFYSAECDERVLDEASKDILRIALESRRDHNLRIVRQFRDGSQRARPLRLEPNSRVSLVVDDVELRLSPDIRAREKTQPKVVYYNYRAQKLNDLIARNTLEIASWVLDSNGIRFPVEALEYVDLHTGTVHRIGRRNPHTIRQVKRNIEIIGKLWKEI
jgi:hypothetical protein